MSPIDDSVTCELCGLIFTQADHRGQGLVNKYRYHVYSKHLKRRFENSFGSMISDKLCSLGDCKCKTFPDTDGVIKHLIGKKHGILEEFLNEELKNKTENLEKIDIKEIKKEMTLVENFEVDDEIMPYSPAKNFSNLEILPETFSADDNVVKKSDEEISSRKKCELCEKTFDKSQYNSVRRKHLYSNHFKERIDKEIDWEPGFFGKICPQGNFL